MNEGGLPINEVIVQLYYANQQTYSIRNVSTDACGNYVFKGLSSGNYKIRFYGSLAGYADEWYNNKSEFNSADTIDVVAPGEIFLMDTVLSIAPNGGISGKISDNAGAEIPGVIVDVYNANRIWISGSVTDVDGNYTVTGIPVGAYKVQFDGQSAGYVDEWYNDKADFGNANNVSITASNITPGINAVLARGGSISGSIIDSNRSGIENVLVSVYDDNYNIVASALSVQNGNYVIEGLPTGNYKIEIRGSGAGYLDEWYGDKVDYATADIVSVMAPNTISGIDAILSYSGGVLEVVPNDNLVSYGYQGGPFSPSGIVYTVRNKGSHPVNWQVNKSREWIGISQTSGTLSSGESAFIGVSINTNATTLPPGSYSDLISFINTTNGIGNTTRTVSLSVLAPSILTISPNKGGNAGSVTVTVTSTGLQEGATAKLVRDIDEIIGTNTQLIDVGKIATTFDLTVASAGLWGLVITNPDSSQISCENCFVVQEGGEAKLWYEILGLESIRAERYQSYIVRFGNAGLVDAKDVSIFLSIPKDIWTELRMDGVDEPFLYDPEQNTGVENEYVMIEAYIGKIKAGAIGSINCKIYGNPSVPIIKLKVIMAVMQQGDYEPITNLGEYIATQTFSDVDETLNDKIINIILLDAMAATPKCPEGKFETRPKRHPFFFMDDGWVYSQNFKDGVLAMRRMTAAEFNVFQNTWPEKYPQEEDKNGNKFYYCPNNIAFVHGSVEVSANQYEQFLNGLQSVLNVPTNLNCILQPDAIADSTGIITTDLSGNVQDGFIPEALEIPGRGAAGDKFAEAFRINPYILPSGCHGCKQEKSFRVNDILDCCPECWDNCQGEEITVVMSFDPNDKASPSGFDLEGTPEELRKKFIPSDHSLGYMVFFENLETASAPAQEVLITDQLDFNLDWTTFSFGTMQIGNKIISVPEDLKNFQTTVDLRPDMPSLVDVDCNLTLATGVFECLFRGKDPDTGELADFLPPNTLSAHPKGQGWISYSIMPKPNLPTGTIIKNKATIDFEVGVLPAPMETPEVFNTIDSGIPISNVLPLAATQTSLSFIVSWSGNDNAGGSGVKNYDIYVSDNVGPYSLWLTTSDTSATFTGINGHQYAFYSRARDNVGNIEDAPAAADAVTTIQATSQYLGDINKDGQIDISDVILELRIALCLDYCNEPLPPCSDINGDGSVDISDVILTLRMALELDDWRSC
jgi:hypothetical protein